MTSFTRPPGLLNKLLGTVHIGWDGKVFLRRWRLLETPWLGIRLQNILRSDRQDPHDHPFGYVTVILWPGYWEHTPDPIIKTSLNRTWRRPGSILFRRAEQLHRIELAHERCPKCRHGALCAQDVPERPSWSLFFRGPIRRKWGFLTRDGWVPAKEYIDKAHRPLGKVIPISR